MQINHSGVAVHTYQDGHHQRDKDKVWVREPLDTLGRSVNLQKQK